ADSAGERDDARTARCVKRHPTTLPAAPRRYSTAAPLRHARPARTTVERSSVFGSIVTSSPSDGRVPRPARTLGMMGHLSTLIGFFLSVPVASGVVGPALLWLGWHHRDTFVSAQAREALNFHVSVL